MSRKLIDAEKLKAHYAWWEDDERRTLFDQIVDAQPTIDAIPIEWIMRYSFDGKRKRPISITKMIADWRKEHAETD